jgi:hypothetical protein
VTEVVTIVVGAAAEAGAAKVLASEVPTSADEGRLWLATTLHALLFLAQSGAT